MYAAVKHIFRS